MDKFEYKRNFGSSSDFSSYDEVPTSKDYSGMDSYESSSDSSLDYKSGYVSDYQEPAQNVGNAPGDGFGGYTVSYQEPAQNVGNAPSDGFGVYTASYQEPTSDSGAFAEGYSSSYFEPAPAVGIGRSPDSDYNNFGSSYEAPAAETGSTSNSDFGSYGSSYEAPAADTGSTSNSDFGSYGSSYEAPVADTGTESTSSSDFGNSGNGSSLLDNEYQPPSNDNNSYSAPSSYEAPEATNAGYSEYSSGSGSNFNYAGGQDDYTAPRNDYTAPGDDYGMPSQMNYGSSTSSYMPPLDKKGRPLKNNFAMKLVFSIIEIFTAPLLGILALVFTCSANNAFRSSDWEKFKSKAKAATIMLWIGFVFTIIGFVLSIWVFMNVYRLGTLLENNAPEVQQEQTVLDEDEDRTVDLDDFADGSDEAGVVEDADTTGEVAVTLPDAQKYNSFKLGGEKVTLPGKMADFVKVIKNRGYSFEYDVKESTIPAGEAVYMSYLNTEGYVIGFVEVYNTTGEEIAVVDGVIGGIYVDADADEGLKIEYLGGITNSSTIEDYEKELGATSSDYHSGSFDSYQWDTDEGWIEIEFDSGKLAGFTIYAYIGLR